MGADDDSSPVVQRRRLRAELRKARQEAGQTQEQVAAAMDWSLSKVIRIETGTVSISANDRICLDPRIPGLGEAGGIASADGSPPYASLPCQRIRRICPA